jgi:hypothetical protein
MRGGASTAQAAPILANSAAFREYVGRRTKFAAALMMNCGMSKTQTCD